MYSPPRVGEEESDKSWLIEKVYSSIDACPRENVNIGIYETAGKMNFGIYQKQGSKWPQMFVGGLKNALVQLNQDDLPRRSLEVKEFFEEAAIAASEDEDSRFRVILTLLVDAIISFINIIR